MIKTFFTGVFTSVGGWTGILAAVVKFGNDNLHYLPPVWGNLVAAVLAVVALYSHANAVQAVRAMGVKGLML